MFPFISIVGKVLICHAFLLANYLIAKYFVQFSPQKSKYFVQTLYNRGQGVEEEGRDATRYNTIEGAGAEYDRLFFALGLFLRYGIRDYRLNYPLCNY